MSNGHILQIFWTADPVVKLTLLILIALSVFSWAIILFKHKEIRRFRISSKRFLEIFWKTENIETLVKKHFVKNPFSQIFQTGIGETLQQSKEPSKLSTIDNIRRKIEHAIEAEIERIERYVSFLATTGSAAPFIGLFGTVWGILAAFWKIGQSGSTSLAVVGPYISEALVATATGLAAAIPAVIFYNFFVGKIRSLTRELNSFGEELTQKIEHDYFRT